MPSTQQQPIPTDEQPIVLESAANSGTIDEVTKLLAGIEPEAEATPEKVEPEVTVTEALAEAEKSQDRGESQEPVKPPKTFDELSEMTGVKVEDLYAIEIPASAEGGENSTIGSLKDLAASESDYAGREIAFEARRVQLENDQVKSSQDLQDLLSAIPRESYSSELLEKAQAARQAYNDREAGLVLQVIPEWADEIAQATDRAEIAEHMAKYGFDAKHLDGVVQHQMIRYMRDNARMATMVAKALGEVKPVKEKVPKTSSPKIAPKAAPLTATPASPLGDQLAAIDSLLTEAK